VQHVVAPLSPSFDFSVSGLYMSFSDHSLQRVSAMFADASAMLAFLRCVAATELHIRSHSANTDPERGAECIANYVLGYALSTYCIILWINLMCCNVRIDICII
jgi:hypothetical protein